MYKLCTYMCISCTHYVDQVPLGEHSVQAEANLLLELNERGGHGGRISQPGPKREQVLRAPRGVGWKLQNPASDRTRSSCRSSCNLRRQRDKSHSLQQSQLTIKAKQETKNARADSKNAITNRTRCELSLTKTSTASCVWCARAYASALASASVSVSVSASARASARQRVCAAVCH